MPSSELIQLAEDGWLHDPLFRESIARVMLSDSRARKGILHFHHQWMDVDAIDQTLIDIETYFPNDMAEEEGALFFVNALMQNAMMIEMDTFADRCWSAQVASEMARAVPAIFLSNGPLLRRPSRHQPRTRQPFHRPSLGSPPHL